MNGVGPYAGALSGRAVEIHRSVDRYEAAGRRDHPDPEPGATLRRPWDRHAWAEARPDKIVPTDGEQLAPRWRDELRDLGFAPPTTAVIHATTPDVRRERVKNLTSRTVERAFGC